jgi:hypothetical protein
VKRFSPISLIAAVIVATIIVFLASLMITVLSGKAKAAEAGNGPSIIAIDGKTYMLLSEEDAGKLLGMLKSQQQTINEQHEKLIKGGCV